MKAKEMASGKWEEMYLVKGPLSDNQTEPHCYARHRSQPMFPLAVNQTYRQEPEPTLAATVKRKINVK